MIDTVLVVLSLLGLSDE